MVDRTEPDESGWLNYLIINFIAIFIRAVGFYHPHTVLARAFGVHPPGTPPPRKINALQCTFNVLHLMRT